MNMAGGYTCVWTDLQSRSFESTWREGRLSNLIPLSTGMGLRLVREARILCPAIFQAQCGQSQSWLERVQDGFHD